MSLVNIASFFEGIRSKILFSFQEHNFDETQKDLLINTFDFYDEKSKLNPISDPVAIFYFISNSLGKKLDEQAELLGAFCTLYILSLDLFDDVQDDDLAGKPHEKIGKPIAINTAITLLFLSIDLLRKVIELEVNNKKQLQYLKVFNRVSLLAVEGQHKDLMGESCTKTRQEVLDMQKAKTSSISLIAECSTIFSDCANETIVKYKKVSEQMVLAVQIVDDIRDIYGKKISPDLITNKITYPIACFLEFATTEQISGYNELKKKLPDSIREIRQLFYDSGAIEKSAEMIEELRINIHKNLASINISNPASTRIWLYIVDSLASSIYTITILEESNFILQPEGEWNTHIKYLANNFFVNMKEFMPPEMPILLPWHLPQWMYVPNRNVIFYPDLDGQPEEILPLQSKLLGLVDLDFVKEVIINESPVVIAHEFFHYWRKVSGKLTEDAWYEEWVANTLSIAYMKFFLPELAKKTKFLIEHILSLKTKTLSIKGKEILNRFFMPNYKPSLEPLGYEVTLEEISLIQIYMISKLYEEEIFLVESVKTLL